MSDQNEQSYHHGKQKRQKGPQKTANLKERAVPSLNSYRNACVLFVEQTRGEPGQGDEDCVGKTDTHAGIQKEGGGEGVNPIKVCFIKQKSVEWYQM